MTSRIRGARKLGPESRIPSLQTYSSHSNHYGVCVAFAGHGDDEFYPGWMVSRDGDGWRASRKGPLTDQQKDHGCVEVVVAGTRDALIRELICQDALAAWWQPQILRIRRARRSASPP